jgi:lipopolysaccharide/colanic/teichoic acid biosynthesis glycosyltransferase
MRNSYDFFSIISRITTMELNNYETLVSSEYIIEQVTPYFTYNQPDLCEIIDCKKSYINIKRIIDIAVSSLLIILMAPLMLVVYTLIYLITKENGIFKQLRIGLKGEAFTIYKFRTMRNNFVSTEFENFLKLNESQGVLVKTNNDPRLYSFGKFLRKTSIDELPQLFNILFGQMSLIGPRPLIESMIKPYPEISKLRTLIKPGITGLWQTSARGNNSSVLQMIAYDTEYIANCSFRMDFKILIKTIAVVIKCKDAV